jgi:hypothetical protein
MWPIIYEFSYDITILQYVSITIYGKVIHGLLGYYSISLFIDQLQELYGFLTTKLTTQYRYPFFWHTKERDANPAPRIRIGTSGPHPPPPAIRIQFLRTLHPLSTSALPHMKR